MAAACLLACACVRSCLVILYSQDTAFRASRRGTFESGFTPPPRRTDRIFPRLPLIGEQAHDEEAAIDSHEGWCEGAERIQDRDGDLVKAWADQADGLVTFAALFSAVVTSFILESYTALQPDPKMITIDLLRQIAAQLNGTTLPVAEGRVFGPDVPFEPALTDVLRNSTLFASLICSLLAAGMGIFYKEWLREYTRDLPDDPRELLRTRQLRYLGMQKWRMQEILSGISIFLQLGVAFFILAVVLFAWPLHPIVRLVLNVFVIIWVVFWIGTAFCPLVSAGCPFRSPLSRAIFGAISFTRYVWRKGRAWVAGNALSATIPLPHTLEAQEQGEVRRAGNDLDEGALAHLYNSHWGDAWLENLDPCVLDLDTEVALRLIRTVVSPRCGAASFEEVLKDPARAVDPEATRLANLWGRIERGRCRSPPPGKTPSTGTRVVDSQPARRPAFDRDQTLVSGGENHDCHSSDDGYGISSTAADTESITSTVSDTQPAGIPMTTFRKDEDITVHIYAVAPERGDCMC